MIRRDRRAELYYAPQGGIAGCAFAAGRPHLLGAEFEAKSQGSHGIGEPLLGGYYAAYELIHQPFEAEPSEPFSWTVVIRSLLTGKVVNEAPTGASSDPSDVGLGPVSSMVVSDTGAAAWIVVDRETVCLRVPEERHCAQVHVLDRRGTRLVAEAAVAKPGATGITPTSLRLREPTASWIEDERRRSLLLR